MKPRPRRRAGIAQAINSKYNRAAAATSRANQAEASSASAANKAAQDKYTKAAGSVDEKTRSAYGSMTRQRVAHQRMAQGPTPEGGTKKMVRASRRRARRGAGHVAARKAALKQYK